MMQCENTEITQYFAKHLQSHLRQLLDLGARYKKRVHGLFRHSRLSLTGTLEMTKGRLTYFT